MFDVDATAAQEMATATGSAAGRPNVECDFIQVCFVLFLAGGFRDFFVANAAVPARCMKLLKGILTSGIMADQAIDIFFAFIIELIPFPA